jgi:endonuclease/exonuclease/phosphatase family metal-dependent hydrolase
MGQNAIDAIFGRRAPHGARLKHNDVISECASNDVFCVQELLSHDACAFFDGLKALAFPSSIRDDNRAHFRTGTMRGTGLGIGSRFSLLEPRFLRFSRRAVGWDRFARKGALHARIEHAEGRRLDVLTVHLQAGTTHPAIETRAAQLIELRKFIDELGSEDRAFVVCGDFNIDGLEHARDSSEYTKMIEAMNGFEDLGARDDLPTVDPKTELCTEEQRLDYIFFRPGKSGLELRSIKRMLDRPLGPPLKFPSDHFGLIAELSDQ